MKKMDFGEAMRNAYARERAEQVALGVHYVLEIRNRGEDEWRPGDPWGSDWGRAYAGTDLEKAKANVEGARKHYDQSVEFRLVRVERTVIA